MKAGLVVWWCGALLLTGCGLPLPHAVQEPGPVRAEQQQRGDIQVLPPGPRDDAPAVQEVRDFFGAQSNPTAGHASARAFLSPQESRHWDDTGPVSVFSGDLTISAVDERLDAFHVTGNLVGRIGSDGSYSPQSGTVSVLVRLARNARGRWVLTSVPPGLLLSVADRDRSFRARSVYFLAPPTGTPAAPTHVVADPVFIAVTADPADALVRRLLAGPSVLLGDSVSTAFPAGTTLLAPVQTTAAGVVTVELSGQVAAAAPLVKELLSAQLVWTLRGVPSFSKLQLRSGGQDVGVAGSGDVGTLQDRTDWASYDPSGLPAQAPAFYISGRRLRNLDEELPNPTGGDGRRPVDVAAVSPRGQQLAILTRVAKGVELRTGPFGGPLVLRLLAPALSFPTWGSGEQGLWFLDGDRVMLAADGASPHEVPVDGIAAYGSVTGLRVARDGVRVGLLVGAGDNRRLVVGRVGLVGGAPHIVGLHSIAPDVTAVRDLSWDSPTSLVVLGKFLGVLAPVRVAVDGSSVTLVARIGLELSVPTAIAAAPGRPLVVAASVGGLPVLFRDNGRLYTRLPGTGYSPFYAG